MKVERGNYKEFEHANVISIAWNFNKKIANGHELKKHGDSFKQINARKLYNKENVDIKVDLYH